MEGMESIFAGYGWLLVKGLSVAAVIVFLLYGHIFLNESKRHDWK